MKIKGFDIFRYDLPLNTPLQLKKVQIESRPGLIVRLTDDAGNKTYGDVAPLPGFSKENVEGCLKQLTTLKSELKGQEVPENLESLDGGFNKWLKKYKLYPSVKFGIETAILNMIARTREVTVSALISERCADLIRINGLVTGSAEDDITGARQMVSAGYQSIKFKVGRGPVEDDIALVQTLFKIFPLGVLVRLDANQAWSYTDAAKFASGIRGTRVDYVEEPLADDARLEELITKTKLSVALDESLAGKKPAKYQPIRGVKAHVLKPTLLGGLETCMQFIRAASGFGIKAVISSSFETSVGMNALAHFAVALGDRQVAHGLDTGRWFENNISSQPLNIQQGRVESAGLTDPGELDFDLLTEAKGG